MNTGLIDPFGRSVEYVRLSVTDRCDLRCFYCLPGDYRIKVGLACQTVVEPGMHLTQIPFYPATRVAYNIEELEGMAEEIWKLYPELFRCLACNACTKVCPMDVKVMDYIAAIKQGDLEKATEISFDCIQCGLCTTRCMAEMSQYHIAQMARRLRGKYLAPRSEHCDKQVEAIALEMPPKLHDYSSSNGQELTLLE